jgi:D-alanine--poly(phosphoribitol) ligase subunit 1
MVHAECLPVIDINERIERAIAAQGDCLAYCTEDERYSYRDLQRRVFAIQGILETDPGSSGSLVGVLADGSFDSYACVLAILRSGRGFVPINPEHPTARNAGILRQADVSVLLTPGDARGAAEPFASEVSLLVARSEGPVAEIPAARTAAEDVAYLLFTSGSTGQPKGVPISRANLNAFLSAFQASGFAPQAGDRVLQMFDFTFDFSVASYLASLAAGATVYPVPRSNAKFAEIYRILSEHSLTVAPLVPSVLNYLRQYFADVHLPDLRTTILCGEALYADVATEWLQCAPASRIANFYGPTEATVFALLYEWRPSAGDEKQANGIASIGRPMQDNIAMVVDDSLAPVGANERGELCLAGPQLTSGYWQDPRRDAAAFFERQEAGQLRRYYRTGDTVVCDADGDHYFLGRLGSQVKVQGYRVELGEVEFHARELSGGCECVVLAEGSATAQLSLVVENFGGDLSELLSALRARLPAYMVPDRARSLASLPMNANGKIDRVALQRSLERS